MGTEEQILPLFPLNTVLFPGSSLPLQIFEDRYKQMLQDCLDGDSRFGVVLIQEGTEVGGQAVPYSTGTVAEIIQVTEVQGGRFLVSCVGRQRFRIQRVTQQTPYLAASVELLAEETDAGVTSELTESVRQAVSTHVVLASGLSGGWVRDVPTPSDPVALSYFVAAALQTDLIRKQAILDEPTVSARLRSELDLLSQSAKELRRMVRRELTQRFSRH